MIGHADGLCTVYLDDSADVAKAKRVVVDSKINYPAACNSAEILIVHDAVINSVWPEVAGALLETGVELLCNQASIAAVPPHPKRDQLVKPATPEDYRTEFLALTMAVTTVSSFEEAIAFINEHSSHHTDSIITETTANASRFCRAVDSAGTFVNASTRFADGLRYGFGTEVGISTGRTHARGPVGLEGLVIYKYMMRSLEDGGHIVGEFGAGKGQKKYKHEEINVDVPPF